MDIASIITTIAIYALPVVLAITIHEAAHGYVAKYFGDPTAYMLGRVTLNPLKHIDPLGTVVLPIAMYLMTGGSMFFGYAKPVPVASHRLRNPRNDMIWVALAGPASNFLQAILWGIVFLAASSSASIFLAKMAQFGIFINTILCVLNLFPLPPLDGGRIVTGLLPPSLAQPFARIEPYGFIIVILLMASNWLNTYWMQPMMSIMATLLQNILLPISIIL